MCSQGISTNESCSPEPQSKAPASLVGDRPPSGGIHYGSRPKPLQFEMAYSKVRDNRPWFFRDKNGTVQKVSDPKERYRRLANLPIGDVIKIGGKYYSPDKPARLHIVGRLP